MGTARDEGVCAGQRLHTGQQNRLQPASRYLNPCLDVGRGPTRSTWTGEKRCEGTGMASTGCPVILPLEQCWHYLHQAVMP
jgi:hypothetical protein